MSATNDGSATITTDRDDILGQNYVRQQLLADEQKLDVIRHNASLPDEAWNTVEDAVYPAMKSVLNVYDDIRGSGLTVDESIFNKTSEWQPIDDDHEATVAMDPETATEEGHVDYELDGVPLPIIMADFSIGWRDSGTSGDMSGGSLDTLNADAAGRAVAEASEDLVINGWGPSIGTNGYEAHGLTTFPDRHTGSLGDWTTSPGAVRDDLRAMAQDLKDDNYRPEGPGYNVYVERSYYDALEDIDPDGTGDLLVRDRVENLSFLNAIRPTDSLDAGEAVMFRPTRDVIDLAVAQSPTTVQWEGPFRDHFKVMASWTPRIKADARGQCGLAHYSN